MGNQAFDRVRPSSKLAEAFATYRARVIPKDANATQIRECKRAFYAGAWAVLTAMMSIEVGPPGEAITEEELVAGANQVEALKLEVEQYVATNLNG